MGLPIAGVGSGRAAVETPPRVSRLLPPNLPPHGRCRRRPNPLPRRNRRPRRPPPTPTPPAASENPILPTGPVSLDEPTVGSISAKKLARAGIRTNVIRGLTLTAPLKTVLERKILSTDEFRALIAGEFERRRDKIEGDQLLYETLGLMDPGTSLYDILLTFSSEGSLSWFNLDEERQYVVLDSEEFTLSHERTYRERIHKPPSGGPLRHQGEVRGAPRGSDDARHALQAILEGDSAITEYIYTTEHFTTDEQAGSILEPNEAFREALNMAPYIAIRTFVFPFAEGLDFAVQLFQSAGNWSLINEALENPPASTEQVLHIEKYMQRARCRSA